MFSFKRYLLASNVLRLLILVSFPVLPSRFFFYALKFLLTHHSPFSTDSSSVRLGTRYLLRTVLGVVLDVMWFSTYCGCSKRAL